MKLFAWALAGLLGFCLTAAAADKINVLIMDGQHNHKWQETTPAINEILTKTGRFNVEVLTSPGPKDTEGWAKFKPDFAKYNVILMNYHGTLWPEDVQKSFEKYMEAGGGLAFYHASLFTFEKWDNWNKMMCLGWRNNKFGDRISIDDSGKIVRTPKGEGPGGSHGPAHEFTVKILDKDHPITKGFPESWLHVKDELYHGQRGPAPETMHIIVTAFSAKEKGGTGTNEPIAWTNTYGKGRIFVTLLGHDLPPTTEAQAAALLARLRMGGVGGGDDCGAGTKMTR